MEAAQTAIGGAAGELLPWLRRALRSVWQRGITSRLEGRGRELRLVESLSVGPRKQLLLVSCGDEKFLVGTGADSVGSIVRVTAESSGLYGAAGEAR